MLFPTILFALYILPVRHDAIIEYRATRDSTAWRSDQLYVALISLGPSWDHSKQAHEQSGFQEHSKNLQRMRKEQRAIVGGRFSDKGIIIFGAENEDEAKAQFNTDPMALGGQFIIQVHRFKPFYDGYIPNQKTH